MSIPLFTSRADTLKKQRLTELAPGHPALEQFSVAVDEARGEFYMRLGRTKLAELEAITPAEPPDTDAEHLRLLASTVEQRLIRVGLLGYLTALLKEGTGGRIHQEWNDVSAFRNMTSEQAKEERKKLLEEADRAFGFLSGNLIAGESPRLRAAAIGSKLDSQYRKVGFSLYAIPPYLFHFSLDTDTLVD